MKKFIYLLLAALCLVTASCAKQGTDRSDVQEAVKQLMSTYPKATMQDIYKSFYQNRFGSGHLIADTAAVRDYLLSELAVAAADEVANPYYELTGADGRYVRVYLRCVNEGLLSAEALEDAFIRSAAPHGEPELPWADEWQAITRAVRDAGLEIPDADNEQLAEASRANRAVRHSDSYREAYHPHYRIVERSIFENEIKMQIYLHN